MPTHSLGMLVRNCDMMMVLEPTVVEKGGQRSVATEREEGTKTVGLVKSWWQKSPLICHFCLLY